MLRPLLVFLLSFGLLGAFASQAQAQTISELPYTEDFEGVTVPELPDGWGNIGNVVTFDGATTIGGTTLEYPTGIAGDDHRIAILPEIDAGIDITTLELSLNAYATSTVGDERIEVGFMSDPADPATFTLVETIVLPADGVVTEEVISLAAYTDGDGRRIALKAESPSNFNRFFVGYVMLEAADVADPYEINIVHNGDFATWVNDRPLGWFGSTTNIPASGVQQYDTETYTGDYAVQLIRTGGTHARFTTQPLSIEADTEYTVRYQVRGSGEIRNAFYRDGAYSSYTGYTIVDSDDWQEIEYTLSHGTAVDDVQVIFSVRNTSDTRDHIQVDGVSITFESEDFIVMPPAFFPPGDTYTDEVTVYLSAPNSDASIFFTDDGSDPSSATTEYTQPILVDADVTLKAVARADDVYSAVAEAEYVIDAATEYATIAEMLENAEIGDEAILSNEVIVTFVSPGFRNQHYLSDATGAVLVDDNNGVLSGLSRGDGITGFVFRYGEFGGAAQLVPLEDIDPSSSDNALPYWETTLADLEYVGEPRLMRVEKVLFQQEGDFASSTNYGIIDPTVTSPVTFRTHLGDSDVIGQPIPQGVVNLVGIAAQFQGNPQLYATHFDLFEDVDVEIGTFALLTPADGTELTVEGGPLDEVVITWERPTATVDEFLQFTWHLDARGGDFSDPILSLPADNDGKANLITFTIEAIDDLLDANGLNVGDVFEADWTVTAEIGTELVFADAAFEIDLQRGELVDRITIVEPPDGDVSLLQPMPLVFNMDTDVVDWTGYTLFPFSGAQLARIPNPDASGLNETDFVLEYVKPEGSDAWAGFFYELEDPVYVTDEALFTLKVWSPRADIEAIMKLEGPEGATTGDLFADVTAAEEWVELEWDLSGQDPNTAWDRVVVIMDLDADDNHPVSASETWYLDDFALEGVDEVPAPPFTTLFQLSAIDDTRPDWMGSDTHTERGMASYGNNVYVVSRYQGTFVYVLDAETGEIKDTLNTEGVSGGTFPLNDVEVSGDGRVYAGNLAIGDAATFKLYELHPTRAPSVVLEFAHPGNNRLGDKLAIVGNWNDGGLTLYAPDGNAAQVFKFEMNGNGNGLFGAPEIISLDVVDAGASPTVAPLADGRFFWTASGRNVHFFEADGTHIGQVSSDIAATSSTALRFIGTEGDDYLLAVYQHGHVSPVGENENIRVVRIPGGDLEEAVVEFITPSMRGTTNPNGTGAVDLVPLDNGNFNLFVLGTNNGVGGYNVTALDVVSPDYSGELEIMPLAEARALPNGRMAMVKGIVNSTDFGFGVADYFIQDESGGLNVTDFDEGGAQKGQVVEPGDSIIIMGVMATFNDQRNIEVGSFQITSRGNPLPDAIVIEGSDMTAESEYQGMRVQLRDMYIIEEDIALWPEDGAATGSGVNIRITSEAEADTFIVRLARNNTAFGEGAGQPLPPAVFHITGTMGQFRQDTQLFPFFADDIVPAAEINWANLQWPPTGDIKEGDEFIVYAQIYVEGLTDDSDQASDDIKAWIGVNSENVAPTAEGWTWIEADFNEDKGNNHEYMADIGSGLTVGTYYYVSRFQLQNFDYVYGGFQGGFWDGENNVSGQLTVAEPTDAELADIPKEFGIDQNYPNPFNPATNIRYAVPQTSHVTIRVYNVTGQLVATLVNETRDAGYHNVVFDGTQLASGVYIYRMQAGDFTHTRKLMLIK